MSKLEIKGISNSGYSHLQETQKTSNNTSKEEKKSDKIEISSAARNMQGMTKDLSEIQKKVSEGFYNSENVIEKTVEALLKEFGLK